MADLLEVPANWFGRQPLFRNGRWRTRLSCEPLETRDTAGNLIGGVVAAVLGAPPPWVARHAE